MSKTYKPVAHTHVFHRHTDMYKTDRQTDRQTDRYRQTADRETQRQAATHTHKQKTDRHTDMDRPTDRQTNDRQTDSGSCRLMVD
jgi:hypothetical protein